MTNHAIVTALPVGEFDTDSVRSEFEAIVGAVREMGVDLAVAEAIADEAGARRFAQAWPERNPDLLLIVVLRGLSAQVIELAARLSTAPCLIWPIQGRFALPSSALATGALREAGAPVELMYAPPEHPAAISRLRCVCRAAVAFSRGRRSRIGLVGGLFSNLVSCRFDEQTVSSRLGITLLPIVYEEIRARMRDNSLIAGEIERSRQAITTAYAAEAADGQTLEAGLKLHLALKQIAGEQGLDAFATECWTGLPGELGLNPCLGFAEDAYTLACEGDVMLCVSLLIVRYLTGARAYVGDLYDIDLDGNLTLVHCGGPASLSADTRQVVVANSQLARQRGFETITCRPRLAQGPVTLFRFYGRDCDRMHVAFGGTVNCEQSPNLSVHVKIAGSRWDFLSQCFGNHYVVAAGDIRPELYLLGQWLGIKIFET
jgi:L-fucose isomerase-like protein